MPDYGYEVVSALRNWRDLEDFGIDALTGESCGYAMRILCDLTQKGIDTLETFFGSNLEIKTGSNWNSNGIASIMLPYSIFTDVAAFALLRERSDTGVVGFEDGTAMAYTGKLPEWREGLVKRHYRRPRENLPERNRHAMSGRTT